MGDNTTANKNKNKNARARKDIWKKLNPEITFLIARKHSIYTTESPE